ncbi:L-aspartate oxidase [Moorellaceae bacterium AZ2]
MQPVPRYLVNFRLTDLPRHQTDVLIIGSGIAGLFTALKLAARYRIMVVTKERPEDCCTYLAQGGMAAVMDEGDSVELHVQDTLAAGAGLGNQEAARVLAEEGPERVRELLEWGIAFDREQGRLALGREGAHSRRRVLHAGGDATGAVIWQGLFTRARAQAGIHILPRTMALDLLVEEGRCFGALVLWPDGSLGAVLAAATVLASGGAGRLYPVTTNPAGATGDGVAMAYRAGAEVVDLEFYQFHPTALAHPSAAGFLITEAVRGEGAILRNEKGERFMPAYHPQAELAPRDVVARAIVREMARTGGGRIYLDLSHLDPVWLERRFPTVITTCRRAGLDPARDWLPVAPAAHYFMGGVRTDLNGHTSLEGLYACGEAACTGVHGANRLGSNSLLEGVVFGGRIARELLDRKLTSPTCPPLQYKELREGGTPAKDTMAAELREIMARRVGLLREGEGLQEAASKLQRYWSRLAYEVPTRRAAESNNMLLLAGLMVTAAAWRRESRGAHYRTDFPAPDPAYMKHLVLAREREPRELPAGPADKERQGFSSGGRKPC